MIIDYDPVSYTATLAWDTVIIKTESGIEQRAARVRLPRLDISEDVLVEPADAKALRASLFTAPAALHEIVVWHEETFVLGSTGVDNIIVSGLAGDCLAAVGRRLILRLADHDDHTAQVTAVGSSGSNYVLTLDPAPAAALRDRPTMVLPLMSVQLKDNATTNRWRLDNIVRWKVETIGRTFFSGGTGADALPTFDGYVLLDVPSSIDDSGLAEQHQGALAGGDAPGYVDLTTGAIAGDISRAARFGWITETERQFWKLFLYTVEGRRQTFLHPTWREDLELAGPTAASGSTLDVLDTPDYRDWFATHKYLALMFDDGTFEPVKVTLVTDNLDGTLTLTLSSAMTTGDTIAYISLLETVRLASDEVEFQLQPGGASFELGLTVVQDYPPAEV